MMRALQLLALVALAVAVAAAGNATDSSEEGIPTVVVDGHEKALKHWFRAAEDGLIPRSGVTVLHFDSHADLAPPGYVPRQWPDHPAEWEADDVVQLNSFILAGVWVGLVERVVWVRPAWGEQEFPLLENDTEVVLSADPAFSGKERWRVTLDNEYYRSANMTLSLERMQDPAPAHNASQGARPWPQRRFLLRVLSFDDVLAGGMAASGLGDAPLVLDVDMDMFATRNPEYAVIRNYVGVPDAKALVQAFGFRRFCFPEDLAERQKAQETWAESMQTVLMKRLYDGPLDEFLLRTKSVQGLFCGTGGRESLSLLHNVMQERLVPQFKHPRHRLESIQDFLTRLFTAANLPHEPNRTEEEVEAAVADVGLLLERWAVKPAFATFARSVEHQFTPLRLWPAIERLLLATLPLSIGPLNVTYEAPLGPGPDRADVPCSDNAQCADYASRMENLDTDADEDEDVDAETILRWAEDPAFVEYAEAQGWGDQIKQFRARMEGDDEYRREMADVKINRRDILRRDDDEDDVDVDEDEDEDEGDSASDADEDADDEDASQAAEGARDTPAPRASTAAAAEAAGEESDTVF